MNPKYYKSTNMSKVDQVIAAMPDELKPLAETFRAETSAQITDRIRAMTEAYLNGAFGESLKLAVKGMATADLLALLDAVNAKLTAASQSKSDYNATIKTVILDSVIVGLDILMARAGV